MKVIIQLTDDLSSTIYAKDLPDFVVGQDDESTKTRLGYYKDDTQVYTFTSSNGNRLLSVGGPDGYEVLDLLGLKSADGVIRVIEYVDTLKEIKPWFQAMDEYIMDTPAKELAKAVIRIKPFFLWIINTHYENFVDVMNSYKYGDEAITRVYEEGYGWLFNRLALERNDVISSIWDVRREILGVDVFNS